MVGKYHDLTDEERSILEKYLPGPFTFILEDDLSVRIPENSIITEITEHYGKPTTATSANLTGEQPVDSIKTLNVKIYLAADLIIENPQFVASAPSTLVDLRSKPFKVLRQGKLPFEA
jgi:L-threonylcarbamoyladenylate synthase